MMDVTILHISDLHLGRDFVFRSLLRRRWPWAKVEDPEILEALGKAIREIAPTYVVISGDTVNKSTKRNFRHAASTLRSLLSNAGIDIKTSVLLIPGNHDVRVRRYNHAYFGRVYQFLEFLKDLFGEKDLLVRKARFVRVDYTRRLCFLCLDSTLKKSFQLAEGEVGSAQWDWFTRKSQRLAETITDFDRFVKIVVLHHHPEAIRASGADRFMQLLDAGEASVRFEQAGIHVVLHGHKHFPHEMTHSLSGGRHYTIIGAGTAACPERDEQAGQGNSFNVLRLKANANLLEVQRWTLNNDQRFAGSYKEPLRYPLFKASEVGYKMRTLRTIARILDQSGRFLFTQERVGVMVDRADFKLPNMGFEWSASSVCAKIAAFDFDRAAVSKAEHEVEEPRHRTGHFVFKTPLSWGGDPVDVSYSYEVQGAVCLERSAFQTFYPGQTDFTEGVSTIVAHPCDELEIIVEFPLRYAPSPWPRIRDNNGNDLSPDPALHVMRSDKLANRHVFLVRAPVLNYKYGIRWEVIDSK